MVGNEPMYGAYEDPGEQEVEEYDEMFGQPYEEPEDIDDWDPFGMGEDEPEPEYFGRMEQGGERIGECGL